MYNEKNSRHFIPGFIRKDIVRKLIALFFAVLVYMIIQSRIGVQEKINAVPVDIDIPAVLVNLDKNAPQVTVTVQGSRKRLDQLSASDIKIKAEVFSAKFIPGSPYQLKLNIDNVDCPYGISVTEVKPSEILLNLEEKVVRQVKVRARFDSERNLPENYKLDNVAVSPAEVRISGPKSLVENLDAVTTAPIPLDAQSVESFDYQAQLNTPGAIGVSPEKVNVRVEIVRQVVEREFKSLPIRALAGANSDMEMEILSSPRADIKVSGPKGTVNDLKAVDLRPFIDVSAFSNPGSYTVVLDCWITAQGIKVTQIYPKEVKLKLTRKKP